MNKQKKSLERLNQWFLSFTEFFFFFKKVQNYNHNPKITQRGNCKYKRKHKGKKKGMNKENKEKKQ